MNEFFEDFFMYLLEFAFFALPAAAVVWFVVSLIRFKKTPQDSPKRKDRKKMLIASSVTAGVMLAAVVGILILMMLVIANM